MRNMKDPILNRGRPEDLPATLRTEAEIDALMARPYAELVDLMRRLPGDLAILDRAFPPPKKATPLEII